MRSVANRAAGRPEPRTPSTACCLAGRPDIPMCRVVYVSSLPLSHMRVKGFTAPAAPAGNRNIHPDGRETRVLRILTNENA